MGYFLDILGIILISAYGSMVNKKMSNNKIIKCKLLLNNDFQIIARV